ncbi:MAG: DUF2249 domain-containing protein [Lapillicoccus sp.]
MNTEATQGVSPEADRTLTAEKVPARHGCSGHCTCDADSLNGPSELDARAAPHALGRPAVLETLDAVSPGDRLTFVASAQPASRNVRLEQRSGDAVAVEYLQLGPDAGRLSLVDKVA